jgi:hypothetical protein
MSRGAQAISQLQKLPWALLLILGTLSVCCSAWIKRIKKNSKKQAENAPLKEVGQDSPQELPNLSFDSGSTLLLRDIILDDYVDRNIHRNVEVPQACEFDPF